MPWGWGVKRGWDGKHSTGSTSKRPAGHLLRPRWSNRERIHGTADSLVRRLPPFCSLVMDSGARRGSHRHWLRHHRGRAGELSSGTTRGGLGHSGVARQSRDARLFRSGGRPAQPEEVAMPTPFKRSLLFVRRWEGGWSDHAQDPGGKTNHGITLATYANWRRSQGLPDPSADDLRAISEEEVEVIYQQNYWDACRCDELPPPIALVVFDMAVNAGPSRSIRLLQEALGVSVDGIIGPETLSAAKAADPQAVAAEFTARRSMYYASLSTFRTFGLGWMRRTAAALSTATVMASHSPEIGRASCR